MPAGAVSADAIYQSCDCPPVIQIASAVAALEIVKQDHLCTGEKIVHGANAEQLSH
jgi:hypothetical protein